MFEEHMRNIERIFNRLREANLVLNRKMRHLFQTKVIYLGYIVVMYGVAVDPYKA